MKYMKLFESKEDDGIIDAFKMCFQELEDKGFEVKIRQILVSWYADFSKDTIIKRHNKLSPDQPKIPYVRVDIYKNRKCFNILDVKEYLLFTESYMKDEFNLNIDHIQILSCGKWGIERIYKSIEYIPLDINISNILIAFKKNKDI